jgi:hypothetical protein
MKADIFIHIGLHKTGSTSIQATMFRNRETLLASGINYLALSENHSSTLFPLLCDAPHRQPINRLAGIDTEAKAARKNAKTEAALRRELVANRCGTLVISGEELSALRPEALAGLRDRLTPFAAGFRVIVYVREPYATVNSIFQQLLREGQTPEQILADPPRPRYRRIKSSITVFGRENVDIRLFDPRAFAKGDLMADFLAAIRAPGELAGKLPSVRSNEALSHEAAHLLYAINRRYPAVDKMPNPGRAADIVERLAAIPGQPFRCPRSIFDASEPFIEEDLRWLRSTLGTQVFPDRPDIDEIAPRWNDETLAAVAVLINDLTKAADKRSLSGDIGAAMADILRRLKSLLPSGRAARAPDKDV